MLGFKFSSGTREMEQAAKGRLQQLGKDLCRLSYQEIQKHICNLDDDSLLELINHRSNKVADTAFGLLNKRDGAPLLVVRALLAGRFTHRNAKVRASNFLAWRGRACPEALTAYLHLLGDKNGEVVGQGLFGIVFLQDSEQLETLRRRRDGLPAESNLRGEFDKAIRAIEEKDPFIFSPGYQDAGNIWCLDKERFGERIGSL